MTTRRYFLKTCAVALATAALVRPSDRPASDANSIWAKDATGHWFTFTHQTHGHYLCLLQAEDHYPTFPLEVADEETLRKFEMHGYVIAQYLKPFYPCKNTKRPQPCEIDWIGF
jgi:hypothetical protein